MRIMSINQTAYIQMMNVLKEWDPFENGPDAYDTEIADCLIAADELDDAHALAGKIQGIYEFSYDRKIEFAACLTVAELLLRIQTDSSCSLWLLQELLNVRKYFLRLFFRQ